MNTDKMRDIINQDSLIIVGMIMIIVVIASIGSYAYVTWVGKDLSGGLITTIGDLATITFDRGVDLSSENLTPVLNYEDGIYNSFSINKLLDSKVYIKASLVINEIDEELKSKSLKYVLLKSYDNNVYESIVVGDFSNVVGNEVKILEDYELEVEVSYYKLYIYIDGRVNNTNIVNKKINMTLNIGASNNIDKINDDILNTDTLITSGTSVVDDGLVTSGVIDGNSNISMPSNDEDIVQNKLEDE